MDYNYKQITWRERDFNIRLYDWCSLRIHDLQVPIWKAKELKRNRYKTNGVSLHKRLKRLLSSLKLKRLIERKDEAKRDQNIRDLSNPYNIPSLQLIHDVIITEKIGSEAMVRDEGKRSKSYGNATNEQRTDNDNTKKGKEMGENINKKKGKDWLAINMRGIFNKRPVDEGNVDISDRRSPKIGNKSPKTGNKDWNTNENYWEREEMEILRDIALDCSTLMCDELDEHHSPLEYSPEELDIQVRNQQEEGVESLNKSQKKEEDQNNEC